ncbi:MAG: hypothetical protein KIT27_04690 [Legionellales bacterium]|nr:hypothetical protein [Legionellales bacterium]
MMEKNIHSHSLKSNENVADFSVLKGAFVVLVVYANEYERLRQEPHGLTHDLIDRFIYVLFHAETQFGVFNLITSIADSQLFKIFPLDYWFADEFINHARQIIAICFLYQKFLQKELLNHIEPSIFNQLIKLQQYCHPHIAHYINFLLTKITEQAPEHYHSHAYAKTHLDPWQQLSEGFIHDSLANVNLAAPNDTILINGTSIQKGSTTVVLNLINEYTNDPTSARTLELFNDYQNRLASLIHLGFFDFFSLEEEWLSRPDNFAPALKKVYEVYRKASNLD